MFVPEQGGHCQGRTPKKVFAGGWALTKPLLGSTTEALSEACGLGVICLGWGQRWFGPIYSTIAG